MFGPPVSPNAGMFQSRGRNSPMLLTQLSSRPKCADPQKSHEAAQSGSPARSPELANMDLHTAHIHKRRWGLCPGVPKYVGILRGVCVKKGTNQAANASSRISAADEKCPFLDLGAEIESEASCWARTAHCQWHSAGGSCRHRR